MAFTVVVTDCDLGNLDQETAELHTMGARLVDGRGLAPDALVALAHDADALLVQWMRISHDIMEQLPRCRAISRYGIGVDMIDLKAATERGIHIFNVPDYCIDEVATHTLMLLLGLNRQYAPLARTLQAGKWGAAGIPPIRRLRGQTLGVVGFGRIGQEVVRKASCLGVNIVVSDPFVTAEAAQQHGATLVTFEELLATSDYVTLHCPLTPQTHHLIGSAALAQMKPGAFLINVSRGPLIDEQALLAALNDGTLAGAALDVLGQEPPAVGHPLLSHPNVLMTPHAAYASTEALGELQRSAAHNLVRFFGGKDLHHLVNTQVQAVRA